MWEISIKQRLGKLNSTLSIDKLFKLAEQNQIEIIQINSEHLMMEINVAVRLRLFGI